MRLLEFLAEAAAQDYQGEHMAPGLDGGAPLHNLCGGDIYPDDVYGANGFQYYAQTGEASDAESFSIAMRLHNRPNTPIMIYRSVPKDPAIKKINPGDWVAISRRYATSHGRSHLNNNYKIISKTVYARDLFTDGNSISEWGYDPQPFDKAYEAAKRARRQARLAAMSDEEYLAAHPLSTAKMTDAEKADFVRRRRSI